MLSMKFLNHENKLFKPFKKGDLLLNTIIACYGCQNESYIIILSTSKCKTSKQCKLTIDTNKTTDNNLAKLENLLKNYTWNLSNTLKTRENGISYTLKTLLNKYNINVSYNICIIPCDIKPIKPIVKKPFFNNLPKQLSFFD